MNMAVAVIDLADSRAIPHTPCPDVQPPPSRVPKPTRSPATTTTVQLSGMWGDGIGYPTKLAVNGARINPR